MKEHPIIFSGPMVRAILTGSKTQTRRVVKPQPPDGYRLHSAAGSNANGLANFKVRPPYRVGDTLWVRETWANVLANGLDIGSGQRRTIYAVDCPATNPRWRPSIHMPRWASRITLEVIGVRVERLQEITEEEARKEGVEVTAGSIAMMGRWNFRKLWDSIYAKRDFGWDTNPCVFVVKFKRIEPCTA